MLGLCALLFVAACVLGLVKNDPLTGKPQLSFDSISLESLPQINLPESLKEMDLSGMTALIKGMELPKWSFGVSPTGLTVKTLRAGEGEAILVCADGYTMCPCIP